MTRRGPVRWTTRLGVPSWLVWGLMALALGGWPGMFVMAALALFDLRRLMDVLIWMLILGWGGLGVLGLVAWGLGVVETLVNLVRFIPGVWPTVRERWRDFLAQAPEQPRLPW